MITTILAFLCIVAILAGFGYWMVGEAILAFIGIIALIGIGLYFLTQKFSLMGRRRTD